MSVGQPEDEFYVDSPLLRPFVAEVRTIVARATSPGEAVVALREPFSRLLADRSWLPSMFRQPSPQGGMGGGISSWLVYRSADRSLTLMSLVVPPGSATPVHDHLSWGLVRLYDGAQEERVYRKLGRSGDGHRQLELVTVRKLQAGQFYDLIPPDNDIHRVKTTSPTASISLHLLANNIGCIWRHTYDPEKSTIIPFRSGYTNVECDDGSERSSGVLRIEELAEGVVERRGFEPHPHLGLHAERVWGAPHLRRLFLGFLPIV